MSERGTVPTYGLLGNHLVLTGWGSPPQLLDDPAHVQATLEGAVVAGNLTLLRIVVQRFEPQGVTAMGLLAESHVAIHTWPERGAFAADLFHCGGLRVDAVVQSLASGLEAQYWNDRVIRRTVSGPEAPPEDGPVRLSGSRDSGSS